jgi:hypothetical protein
MLTRRKTLLISFAAFMGDRSSQAHPTTGCIFGAIRWDAQYCDIPGQPCFEEEKSLGPSKWQFRAPLHTKVLSSAKIQFAATQQTFDDEINAAAQGGLKYWAYLMYGQNGIIDLEHSMMQGLAFHRASKIKERMRYAMMITIGTLGSTENCDIAIGKIVGLMRDTNYLTVLSGRPVIYLYYEAPLLKIYWGSSLGNLSGAVDKLRSASKSSGLGNPYIVVMAAPPVVAESVRSAVRGDAISAYATSIQARSDTPYAELASAVRSYWTAERDASGSGIIPTVMIGWDTRPRKEHPPAYDRSDHSHVDVSAHVAPPTPAEFAAECRAAVKFIDDNPRGCNSRLALIYAWNEDSEGGPLEPTLGDPKASKLAAASDVIR